MERDILKKLQTWKDSKYRKPLILKGARQVGKTWALKEFGRRCFQNTAYFNLDENAEYRQLFEQTKDVRRLLQNLAMAGGNVIRPGETLLVIDEIQESGQALGALKYFQENASDLHVACAGSLLGIALAEPASFPVGKVNFLDLLPMSFMEFLRANGDENLAEYMETLDQLEPVPDAFFHPLEEKLRMYLITGGMPESVFAWTQERDIALVQTVLGDILNTYERDFAKHAGKTQFPRISYIWNSIPSQLSRENKKFLYKAVKEGARAREYEDALQWLCDANLVKKVLRSTAPGLPMSAYDDLTAFKLYMSDVGLLRRLSRLAPSVFAEGSRLFVEFKGALSENFVLQSLVKQFEVMPRYWAVDNPSHEVDFLIQRENEIIPIEVKSDTNVESRSLKRYAEKYPERTKLRVRLSLQNLKLDGNLLNIPLFLADQTDRLIGMALSSGRGL